jgi:hypothetical protein
MNSENNYKEEKEENSNKQEEDDDRLSYTLITLGLENLIHIFEENNISFIDLLLLSKEDLIELQLEMFQRNRIFHFSKLFSKYAKNYSISEISDFFSFNKQFIFNSAIYDRVTGNNIEDEEYQNTGTFFNNNSNENMILKNRNYNITDLEKEDIPEKLIIKRKEFQTKKNININNDKINNKKKEEKSKKNNKKTKEKIKEKKSKLNEKLNNNLTQQNKRNKNNSLNDNSSYYTYDSNLQNSMIKTSKSNKAYQKYLEIQQESDSILEKLNKQKEDSEIIKNKYHNLLNKSKNNNPSKISQMIQELKGSINDENIDYEEEESKNNLNDNNIDINEEYQKMINRIEEIETIKLNKNSIEHLNQIKQFINEKNVYITLEDINKINQELDKLMKIIYKKENLKKELENCNFKIKESKKKLSDLNDNDFNVDEVEELDEENDLNSNKNSQIKKRKK